jgi:hypothetical protein
VAEEELLIILQLAAAVHSELQFTVQLGAGVQWDTGSNKVSLTMRRAAATRQQRE